MMSPTEFVSDIKKKLIRKIDRKVRLISNSQEKAGIINIDPDSIEWQFGYVVSDKAVIDEGMIRHIVRFIVYSKDVWYQEEDTVYLNKGIVEDLPRILKEI